MSYLGYALVNRLLHSPLTSDLVYPVIWFPKPFGPGRGLLVDRVLFIGEPVTSLTSEVTLGTRAVLYVLYPELFGPGKGC